MGIEIITYDVIQKDECNQVKGKFIQFYHLQREVFVFASYATHQFHNQILNHYLSDRDLYSNWTSKENLEYNPHDIQIQGGGRFNIDFAMHTLELWDSSYAYGRFDDVDLKRKLASSDHVWNSFALNCH